LIDYDILPVNYISFRHRLAALDKFKSAVPGVTSPINDAKYSKAGNMIVYSVSYDWSRGSENNDKRVRYVLRPYTIVFHLDFVFHLFYRVDWNKPIYSSFRCF
jgi:hypothetical protein